MIAGASQPGGTGLGQASAACCTLSRDATRPAPGDGHCLRLDRAAPRKLKVAACCEGPKSLNRHREYLLVDPFVAGHHGLRRELVSRKANVGAIPILLTLSPSMTRDALEAGASAAVTAGASAAVARRPHGSRHGAGSPASWRPSRP
jgi:hypothetical protein